MNKVSFALLGACFLLSGTISSGNASEFGNVFGSEEIEQQSRAASALALEGIIAVIEEIRLREIDAGGKGDGLLRASEILNKSSQLMQEILDGKHGEFISYEYIDSVISPLQVRLSQIERSFGVDHSNNTYQLYSNFIYMTIISADFMSKAHNEQVGPVYPNISRLLSEYFEYAGLVTVLSRRLIAR